ncbi:hypothetical protein NXC24_PC00531 (plasmid) [Rhizobium sp. NXC24]|nr:hypothetical protein NXC24_PC00531 [Rhizobium sp. NXC24]
MRHLRIVAILVSTTIGGMIVPALAQESPIPTMEQGPVGAERMGPPPAWMGSERGPCPGFRGDPRLGGPMMAFGNGLPFPPPHAPPPDFPPRPDHAWELASRLSAMETLIGIHVAQLDAWRDYTAALTDLLDVPEQMPPKPVSETETKPSTPDAGSSKPSELFGEEIADHMLDRAAKARVLKDKAAALRSVLTAYQLKKLEDAERSLDPGPGRFH